MQSKAYLPTAEKELLNEAMRISDTAKFTISAFVIVLSSFEKATAKMIKVFPLMNIKILKMKKCSFLGEVKFTDYSDYSDDSKILMHN